MKIESLEHMFSWYFLYNQYFVYTTCAEFSNVLSYNTDSAIVILLSDLLSINVLIVY